MKLLVTGASGFLGKYVVAEALRRGHQVSAVIRATTNEQSLSWSNHPAVELVCLDLRHQNGITEAVRGMDAVIHLAATKAGDFDTQFAGTVTLTENLLKALVEAQVWRLVAISTFSVFDYLHIPANEIINEESPIDRDPSQRDAYARTKLIQEDTIRNFAHHQGGQVTILRPGVVYGRDNLWNARLGARLGNNLWIHIRTPGEIPLTYVENCAKAIVAAAECEQAIGETLNLVDDNLPSQKTYLQQLIMRMSSQPRTIPINWTVMRVLANTVWQGNRWLFKGKLKLPGILVPARLDARFKPFRYSNSKVKQILNWTPKYSLETALDRSCGDVALLEVSDDMNSTLSFSPD